MSHIILDSSPLGVLSNPSKSPDVMAAERWARLCVAAGNQVYIPEIVDYEVRRELIRTRKQAGLRKLDGLAAAFTYIPLSRTALRLAAELWAQARQSGLPTADPKELDVDVILCAQALTLGAPLQDLIVATSNVGHISRFVAADLWSNIEP